MNDPEFGRAIYSIWGGLNDVTRNPLVKTGINSSQVTFGGIGGISNINVRPTSIRTGSKISYARSNRSYSNRLMITHATGMMGNGLAISLSGSWRYAKEGYVAGSFYDAASYYMGIEKKINDKHTIGIIGMGAPTKRGKQGIALQEAYDLSGNNYYNPYWGYQNGEKRNSRVVDSHKPIFMLNHYWKKSEVMNINSGLYYSTGKYGQSSLNWDDAEDPRPDYYRYLPSYYEEDNKIQYAYLTDQWTNNESFRQVDWSRLYNGNYKNLYTVENADGSGTSLTGNRSKYIVEQWRNDPTLIGFNSNFNAKLSAKLKASGGVDISMYKSRNYKSIKDLLGGDFWIDTDKFAQEDSENENIAQNDLNHINNIVTENEKFGYDYEININKQKAFYQIEYAIGKIDLYSGITLTNTSFWRKGNMKNGRFPDNSFGKSAVQKYFNYGAKSGLVYKLTGRHFISANGAYLTRPPYTRNSYVSPRVNDNLVPQLTSQKIMSGDLNYVIRHPKLKSRLSVFYTEINDQTWTRSFYHDELSTFVNYSMSGVDQLFTGLEFGVEAKVSGSFDLTAAYTTGQYLWNSRPTAIITRDNSAEVLAEDRTLYIKNYRIGGMPQTATSVGVKYNAARYWFSGLSFNYFSDIYLDFNADRRSEEALDKYITADPQWNELLDQTKLPNGYSLDLIAGKSWRVNGHYMSLFVSISNILNTQNFITGGFEQLRYDPNDIDKFPSKYSYMYGTSYFVMFTFSP